MLNSAVWKFLSKTNKSKDIAFSSETHMLIDEATFKALGKPLEGIQVGNLDPSSIVRIVVAYASGNVYNKGIFDQFGDVIISTINHFSAKELASIALAYNRYNKAQNSVNCAKIFEHVVHRAMIPDVSCNLTFRDIANISSVAVETKSNQKKLFQQFQNEIIHRDLGNFATPKNFSLFLTSYVKCGYSDKDLLMYIGEKLPFSKSRLTPKILADIAWAYSMLSITILV